jgi:branched-chain amino acid transport system substrate-binding protein
MIIAIVALALIAFGSYRLAKTRNPDISSSSQQEIIKIGMISHLSGKYAAYGIPMKNAVELATEKVNQNSTKRKFELIIEDDEGESNKAASAINKLVSVDNVNYIISAQASGVTSAIVPIAQDSRKIMMITLASVPDLTKQRQFIFRSVPSDDYQAQKMIDFIKNRLNATRVAGLYVNDAYGLGIKNMIEKSNKFDIGSGEMFESGASDFRTSLTKIKQTRTEALVIVARETEYPLILKQIKELNFNIPIIASETFKDDNILKACGTNAEGVYVSFMAEPEDFLNFKDLYNQKFKEAPSAYSKYGYDGALALMNAISESDNQFDIIRDNLAAIQFNGASGLFKFDNNRERTKIKYDIFKVSNQSFIPEYQ